MVSLGKLGVFFYTHAATFFKLPNLGGEIWCSCLFLFFLWFAFTLLDMLSSSSFATFYVVLLWLKKTDKKING